MPNEMLPWNEENLTQVLSDLYREILTRPDLRRELMTDPYSVLSTRIDVPGEYRGKIIAQDRTAKILVLNVPDVAETSEAIAGTMSASDVPDFLICTTETDW